MSDCSSATVSALVGGFLSDKISKKGLVYFSAGVQSIVICLAIIPIFQRLEFVLSLAGFFGIGYGIFQSVDWSLATQVLSSSKDFGKDMSIWQLSGGMTALEKNRKNQDFK